MRRWDDAHAAFTRAIELRPEHVQVWEARGELLYVRLGLWDLAAHDLEQAFRLQRPNFPRRWLWTAFYVSIKEIKPATTKFVRACKNATRAMAGPTTPPFSFAPGFFRPSKFR